MTKSRNKQKNARLRAVIDVSAICINVPKKQDFKCQIKQTNDLNDLDDVDDIPNLNSQQIEENLNLNTLAEAELSRNLHTSTMPGGQI